MKKVAIILLVVLALGALVVGVLWWAGNPDRSANASLAAGIKKIERLDSDGDGLKDWEEELWQTDKNRADTDGDGTSDGAEISASRNPQKTGLDNLVGSKDRLQALVRNAMQNADRPLTAATGPLPALLGYQKSDLTLEPAETVASLNAYAAGLRQILTSFAQSGGSQAPLQLLAYLQQGQTAALTELTANLDPHLTLTERLLALSTPASAATKQLDLVNRAAYLAELVFLMSRVTEEPLLAARAGQDYPTKLLEFLDATRRLDVYFNARGIK